MFSYSAEYGTVAVPAELGAGAGPVAAREQQLDHARRCQLVVRQELRGTAGPVQRTAQLSCRRVPLGEGGRRFGGSVSEPGALFIDPALELRRIR